MNKSLGAGSGRALANGDNIAAGVATRCGHECDMSSVEIK